MGGRGARSGTARQLSFHCCYPSSEVRARAKPAITASFRVLSPRDPSSGGGVVRAPRGHTGTRDRSGAASVDASREGSDLGGVGSERAARTRRTCAARVGLGARGGRVLDAPGAFEIDGLRGRGVVLERGRRRRAPVRAMRRAALAQSARRARDARRGGGHRTAHGCVSRRPAPPSLAPRQMAPPPTPSARRVSRPSLLTPSLLPRALPP